MDWRGRRRTRPVADRRCHRRRRGRRRCDLRPRRDPRRRSRWTLCPSRRSLHRWTGTSHWTCAMGSSGTVGGERRASSTTPRQGASGGVTPRGVSIRVAITPEASSRGRRWSPSPGTLAGVATVAAGSRRWRERSRGGVDPGHHEGTRGAGARGRAAGKSKSEDVVEAFSRARHGRVKELDALFQRKHVDPASRDQHGLTLLHMAAQNNQRKAAKLVLKRTDFCHGPASPRAHKLADEFGSHAVALRVRVRVPRAG